jgi:hypothetical protein
MPSCSLRRVFRHEPLKKTIGLEGLRAAGLSMPSTSQGSYLTATDDKVTFMHAWKRVLVESLAPQPKCMNVPYPFFTKYYSSAARCGEAWRINHIC